MCPASTPLPENDLNWSGEQISKFLDDYTPESHLPRNVLADLNPYGYQPSNLPEGIWYLLRPNDKNDSVYGFWKARNEACEVYSNGLITGWRTTLEYYEGQAPHGQRTDWLMQVYSVTQTGVDKHTPEKDSRLLCRVFHCSGHSSKSEAPPQNCKTVAEFEKATRTRRVGAVGEPGEEKSNSSPLLLSELEYLETGDYIKLDDLEDQSNFTSSQNSTCPSNLSDDCFDSLALLQDIKEDENKRNQTEQSSSRYNFTPSVRPSDVVLQPASSGTAAKIELLDGSQTSLVLPAGSSEERAKEHSTESRIPDSRVEDISIPSTSRKNTTPSGRKKPKSEKTKRLKLYFCFAPF